MQVTALRLPPRGDDPPNSGQEPATSTHGARQVELASTTSWRFAWSHRVLEGNDWAIPGLRGVPLNYCEPATPSIRSVVPALASKTVREPRSAQDQALNERRQSLRLAAADLVRRTRAEQGLPPTIIDLQALHRVAVLLSGTSNDGDGHIRPPNTADVPERQVGEGRFTLGKSPSDHIDADTAKNGCARDSGGNGNAVHDRNRAAPPGSRHTSASGDVDAPVRGTIGLDVDDIGGAEDGTHPLARRL